MTRSSWKNSFLDPSILKHWSRIWSRRSIILDEFIGRTVHVHKGNGFVAIKIVAAMVGHKLGEFALTRKHRQVKRS